MVMTRRPAPTEFRSRRSKFPESSNSSPVIKTVIFLLHMRFLRSGGVRVRQIFHTMGYLPVDY